MMAEPSPFPPPYRLRLPGPTAVPERVFQAIDRPVVSHRGPEFRALFSRVEQLIQPILGTHHPVLFFASSGTGMMEASLVNVFGPGERLLVVVNGQFGERFAAIACALGIHVDRLEVPWGRAADPDSIEARVKTNEYQAVVIIQNESSTGIATNLAGIGSVLRKSQTLLVVDSVSGLGGLEMKQEEWGVDVVVSASQKALMCPPGIGLVSLSSKAWEIAKSETRLPRFYWDYRKARASAEKSEMPFTAPVSLLSGLREALEMIHEEGLPHVLARHARLSAALRAGAAALGLLPFGEVNARSSTVVVLEVPEKLNAAEIVRRLYEQHRTIIAGARNKLAGRVIRIGTMGHVDQTDILLDLQHLEEVLTEMGWPVSAGAGVAAASAVVNS